MLAGSPGFPVSPGPTLGRCVVSVSKTGLKHRGRDRKRFYRVCMKVFMALL